MYTIGSDGIMLFWCSTVSWDWYNFFCILKNTFTREIPRGGGMLMKTVYKYLVYEERIWGHVASCGIWSMKYGSLVVNSQILK